MIRLQNLVSRFNLNPWAARSATIGMIASAMVCAMAVEIRGEGLAPAARSKSVSFQRDIRPILADKCFKCHGPDAGERKGKLRLDNARDAQTPAASGSAAIVPGKPDDSELYQRISATDPDQQMPPRKSGKSLSAVEIANIKTWIEGGAEYQGHWAFSPPRRPPLPIVRNAAWCRTPIDRFIVARLEAEGLGPSPEADKATFIRRLSLDLIGLPPTIQEVDAFQNDARSLAYENLVSHLLESAHHGERWGRIWLDAARYADSDGYEKDKPRQVFFYRDWVIAAMNRDLPYNRFIVEQIAGDLLPGATQDQIVATGFLRNSMINEEGGVDPEQFRMEAMFDRLDCVGKGILGLTIQCAQCHSHKYDPLTQDEYYGIFAFLNNADEANVAVYTHEEQAKNEKISREIREVEDLLRRQNPDWGKRMAAWEERVVGDQPAWVVMRPRVDEESTGGAKYNPLEDGSVLVQGYAPTKHTVVMSVNTSVTSITAFRLELLTDANLPMGGPGRSVKGTGALSEFRVHAAPADGKGAPTDVKFARATSDLNSPEAPLDAMFDDRSGKKRVTGPIDFAIDGKSETAWGTDTGPGRRNQPCKAVFTAEKPVGFAGGTILKFYLTQNHGGWNSDDNQNCNLGRFRLAITTTPGATADPVPQRVREILAIPREKRTEAQTNAVFSFWRTTVPDWNGANAWIESLWKQHPEGSTQLALSERARRRPTHLLVRGDFLKPGKSMSPGVPSFLNPLPPGAQASRLTFARWLVDRDSPTTARSLLNRVWQAYFGTGLAATTEDLGLQCEPPSHPELLDWLAVEFMENGWSLKHLHRLIVTSAVYRQSSRPTPELLARDPYNRLLARGPRSRVDAEMVRDIALAASGVLNPKISGPSVCPPAPAFLFQPPTSYGPKVWTEAVGPERYRRALYTFRYRSVPYPMLQAFDAPNGDFACVRRTKSNTPLQALTTLNEPIYLECARALALRTLSDGGSSDIDRLTYAFRRCLARKPSESETATVLDLLRRQTERFHRLGANPWELAAHDPAKPPTVPAGASPPQLAAWTAVARVLLNLDETITKE